MLHTSGTSNQQKAPENIDGPALVEEPQQSVPEHAGQWVAISELRERPSAGGHIAFLTYWALRPDQNAQADAGNDEVAKIEDSPAAAELPMALPPLDLLRTVARRWARLGGQEGDEQPALVSFRVAAALSPQEVSAWCPGATVRLYTLGGLVAPLPDTLLAEEPLARYSVVRAPTMNFWPELRTLIEAQEREQPGLDRWEDLHDLDLLEQELAFWLASPYGLIVNLYAGDELVGHLSLARQRDETEGCDGWGIIALHIASRARGQRLSVLLQHIAATLIVTQRQERQLTQMLQAVRPVAVKETGAADMGAMLVEQSRDTGDQGLPDQGANPSDESFALSEAAGALSAEAEQGDPVAGMLEQPWPYFFGFIPPGNIPALRGAYAAGREIIATYVDVPIAALEQQA